jgi:hypothetical protein
MWPIFHGLNDWRIIEVKPATKGDHKEDLHAAQDVVLESLVKAMMGKVKEGNIGAFVTEDSESDGYYVVRFKSAPYALTCQTKLTKFNPTTVVKEGALVVDAEYLNMVPRSQRWYTPSSLQTKVQLQQVVHPNLTLVAESGNNRLPNGCDKRSARSLGATHVSEQQQEEILDQLTRRAIIQHEENVQEYELEAENDDDVEVAPSDGDSSKDETRDEEA